MTSWEKGIRPAGNLHPFHIVHNKNILAIIGRHTSSVFRRLIVMEAKYSKIFTKKLHSIPVSLLLCSMHPMRFFPPLWVQQSRKNMSSFLHCQKCLFSSLCFLRMLRIFLQGSPRHVDNQRQKVGKYLKKYLS